MVVNWKIAEDGQPCTSQCASVGSSANTMYVTLANPVLPGSDSTLLRSEVHLATVNSGAGIPAQAFANTWAMFALPSNAGPANVSAWDGRPLIYYLSGVSGTPGSTCATNARGLLTASNENGQCGSFANLLLWSLAANGININPYEPPPIGLVAPTPSAPASWTQINTADQLTNKTKMLINKWKYSQTPTYPGNNPYFWLMNINLTGDYMVPAPSGGFGDLANEPGIAGQNSPTPADKIFDYHFIVKVDPTLLTGTGLSGPYFDPSYGNQYTNNCDFENQAVSGYIMPNVDTTYGITFGAMQQDGGCNIVLIH